MDEILAFAQRHLLVPAQQEAHQVEYGDLGNEHLGGSDTDLRAGVVVDSSVGQTGDRTAHHVDETQTQSAAPFDLTYDGQDVSGFPRLTDGQNRCARLQVQLSVLELGGQIHIHGMVGAALDDVNAPVGRHSTRSRTPV